MASTITAAVITLNEERHIRSCLDGLSWANEILVVDAHSSDSTAALAREAGARVALRTFDTFACQRNYALDQAQGDWILFVDADERVEQSLADETAAVVDQGAGWMEQPVGYWLSRRNIMLGRWVQHAGWWPDYQMRLFRRGRARYDEHRDPHEIVLVQGPTAYLSNSLLHYNYTSVRELFCKQRAYARREARVLVRQGVRPRPYRFFTHPLREFYRRYIQLEGYKDGPLGLLLALTMAWSRFQVCADLLRKGD